MAGRGIQLPCPMDMGYGGISSDDDSSPKELFGAGIPSAKELFMDIHDMPYSSRLGVTTTHHACGAPATSREHEHHHDHHAQSPAATGDVLSSQEEPARKRLHSDATRCDVDWRQGEHTASMSQGYEQLAGQNMMVRRVQTRTWTHDVIIPSYRVHRIDSPRRSELMRCFVRLMGHACAGTLQRGRRTDERGRWERQQRLR